MTEEGSVGEEKSDNTGSKEADPETGKRRAQRPLGRMALRLFHPKLREVRHTAFGENSGKTSIPSIISVNARNNFGIPRLPLLFLLTD